MLTGRGTAVAAAAIVTACSWGAEPALPREYYVDYMRVAADVQFACSQGQVELVALLVELRAAIDDKLTQNNLPDARELLDLDTPDEIGTKTINGQPYARYRFSRRRVSDVIFPGEGGVIIVLQPCTKHVVDAVAFTFP